MSVEPLELSAKAIDEGVYGGPMSVNRMNTELSEVGEGVAFIEAFSNVVAFRTQEGLVLFDTSLEAFAPAVHGSLRRWSEDRVGTICFTHGHVDHVGGAKAFVDDDAPPEVIGHEGVLARFDRYERTNDWNRIINQRQFATIGGGMLGGGADGRAGARFGPTTWVRPTTTYHERLTVERGDVTFELHHARGETDDHTWAWEPRSRSVIAGDFVAWVFPNAGNPQKVQRFPGEWAAALRAMAALEPELLLPAHGLPVAGTARIQELLTTTAGALESLVAQTLERMNAGETLNDCIHGVKLSEELLDRPYLRPVYDEPEFIVRNVWRQYGGWYDGDPSHLHPAPASVFAKEIAALAGSPEALAKRAEAVAASDLRLAGQLIELAAQAAPDSTEVHAARKRIYGKRRDDALSLMAKGIYQDAVNGSSAITD